MLLIFMGPSSTGKSTIAKHYKQNYNFLVYTGKDYLRLSKNENDAWRLFKDKLIEASNCNELSKSIIYIITDIPFINKIKDISNVKLIKFTANIETLKQRFSKRTNGLLPPSIAVMLERQLTEWNKIESDACFDTTNSDTLEIIDRINNFINLN